MNLTNLNSFFGVIRYLSGTHLVTVNTNYLARNDGVTFKLYEINYNFTRVIQHLRDYGSFKYSVYYHGRQCADDWVANVEGIIINVEARP